MPQVATQIRPVTLDEVSIYIHVEQDQTPIIGNALASGDEKVDREYEHELAKRLVQDGDVWAWASITVNAHWCGFTGRDSLGCCTYKDEEDFKQHSEYYEDMVEVALRDLNDQISDKWEILRRRAI